jgi:hypothetical protein
MFLGEHGMVKATARNAGPGASMRVRPSCILPDCSHFQEPYAEVLKLRCKVYMTKLRFLLVKEASARNPVGGGGRRRGSVVGVCDFFHEECGCISRNGSSDGDESRH